MSKFTTTTHTWADGFGNWHARVEFAYALSVNDDRLEFNLDAKWGTIRRAARRAILREIEMRTPVLAHVGYSPKIEVETTSDKQGFGILHSVTFKETIA